MTKRALVLMRGHIKQFDLPVKLVMTVHDQIDTICKNDYVEDWSRLMKELILLVEVLKKKLMKRLQ